MPFTHYQQQAVDFDKGNCLVSAGAGSGKTAVLTERIFQLIKSREDERKTNGGESLLPHLLVLTFTNKAAYEMKDRVRQKIAKSDFAYLAPDVEQAKITTFDAFALDLVKTYHYDLGIDREVSLVDQSILEVCRKRILDEIFERRSAAALEGEDPAWKELTAQYCLKSSENLRKYILTVGKALDLESDKEAYLRNYESTYFSEAFFEKNMADFEATIRTLLTTQRDLIEANYDDPAAAAADTAAIDVILSHPDFDTLCSYLTSGKSVFPIYKSKGKEIWFQNKEVRNALKDKYLAKAKELASVGTRDELHGRFQLVQPFARTILEVVEEIDKRLEAFKAAHAAYDFADIAALARKVASIPAVREKLQSQFEYIMVDEYQDTSDLQEDLISLLSRDNVFMVGDMKQSIYGFRNANPAIFQKKLEAYGKGEGGTLITLPDNFRSRRQVIDAINAIFGDIMTKEVGGVNYKDNQGLRFGNTSYDPSENNEEYGAECLKFDRDETKTVGRDYCETILRDIKWKLANGYRVYDKEKKEVRPATYRDFAILIRAKHDFDIYAKLFNEAGVPLQVVGEPAANSEDVVLVMKNLCALAVELDSPENNFQRRKRLYVSLARSFLFHKSDADIAKAVLEKRFYQDDFFRFMEKNASRLCEGNLVDGIEFLLKEFGFLSEVAHLTNVQTNIERVEHLLRLAENASSLGWRMAEWVEYLSDLDKYEIELDLPSGDEEKDAVRLMSIHASKGLQFPIVYFPRLDSKFNRSSSNSSMRVSKKFGLILPYYENIDQLPDGIFAYLDKNEDARENLSEMMRLLYVALTRVEETMIIVRPSSAEADKPLMNLASASSFQAFLGASDTFEYALVNENTDEAPELEKAEKVAQRSLEIRAIEDIAVVNELPRPSKAMTHPVDEGSLRYGEAPHRLLEVTDFQEDEYPWANSTEQAKIKKVFSTELFARRKEAKSFHEYDFVNPTTGVHGSIDLLMVYEDHIDIIDYKSSNIDDENYDKQLNAYEDYIKQVFPGMPIRKFLLSISEVRFREVK